MRSPRKISSPLATLRPTVAAGVRNETCWTGPLTAAATPALVPACCCAGASAVPSASTDAAPSKVRETLGRLRFIGVSDRQRRCPDSALLLHRAALPSTDSPSGVLHTRNLTRNPMPSIAVAAGRRRGRAAGPAAVLVDVGDRLEQFL